MSITSKPKPLPPPFAVPYGRVIRSGAGDHVMVDQRWIEYLQSLDTAVRALCGDAISSGNGFAANGTVATAMSSLGPVGAHTTIQEWLTVVDNGVTRYIPCF
jgi:hypothetical protein